MNKKLKIFVALVLVLQLFIPSFLLIYNKTIIDNALKYGTDYTFRLEYAYLNQKTTASEEEYTLFYSIYSYNLLMYRTENISVTEASNGFISLTQRKTSDTGNNWFRYKNYVKNCSVSADSFSPEGELSYRDIYLLLNQERLKQDENEVFYENAYIVAKVYKGMFIPMALYLNGEKILTITIA